MLALLIDFVIMAAAFGIAIPLVYAAELPPTILSIGVLVTVGVAIWNHVFLQGTSGQTIGKSTAGVRLVRQADGQPPGRGLAFVHLLCHFVDYLTCGLTLLWPLWDPKRQTLADKMVRTIVISSRRETR